MEKFEIVNGKTGEIVAYTTINGLESDYNLTNEEIIQDRIQSAIDDGILEDNNYQYYKTNKIISGLLLI